MNSVCSLLWLNVDQIFEHSVQKFLYCFEAMSVAVLKNCKRFLSYLGLGGGPPIVLFNRKISKFDTRLYCLIVFQLSFIPLTVYTFEQSENFNYINSALYTFFEADLLLLVYIDHIRKDVVIQRVFEQLERVVLKSVCEKWNFFWSRGYFHSIHSYCRTQGRKLKKML